MRVKLLDQDYTLANPADVVRYVGMLGDKLTWLHSEVVKIGNDQLTTAHKMRENGEWLRRNWPGSPAAPAAAALPAVMAMAAAARQKQEVPTASAPAAAPAAGSDPHRSPSAPPTLQEKAPPLVNNGGSVELMNADSGGPAATDRGFWLRIQLDGAGCPPDLVLCTVKFGTAYSVVPNVFVAESGEQYGAIRPVGIGKAGFQLVTSGGLAPGAAYTVVISVLPNAGDPTF